MEQIPLVEIPHISLRHDYPGMCTEFLLAPYSMKETCEDSYKTRLFGLLDIIMERKKFASKDVHSQARRGR